MTDVLADTRELKVEEGKHLIPLLIIFLFLLNFLVILFLTERITNLPSYLRNVKKNVLGMANN